MGLDWGLYSAMRGTDNWQQRRADAQMNLQIIEKQNAIEEQKTQKALQAEQGLAEYFNELENMEFLEQDQDRVSQVERDARANVVKGIANVNGDLTRYMSTGGLTDLNTYRQSVMKSDEVKQATLNKANLKNYLDAKQKDLYVHRVNVPITLTEDDGETARIDPNTGEPMTQMKPMTFEENMALFKAGKVDKLYFEGAEKKHAVNPLIFSKQPKDPRNPFSDDNLVTTSNIVNYLTKQGASKEQAEDIARQYAETTKAGGDPWRWGNKSNLEKQLIEEKINKIRSSGSGGSSGTQILNQEIPAIKSMRVGDRGVVVTPKAYDLWKQHLRLNYDEKTRTQRPMGPLKAYDSDPNSRMEYDLSKALSVDLGQEYVKFKDKNGNVQNGIIANVIYAADESNEDGTPIDEGFLYSNDTKKGAGSGWEYGNAGEFGILDEDNSGVDVYRGEVFIPITKEVGSNLFQDEMGMKKRVTDKLQGYAPSATRADQNAYINSVIEAHMQIHDVDYNTAKLQLMNR